MNPTVDSHPSLTYEVEIDGQREELIAQSLAEVTNRVRGRGKRVRVWSPVGLLLIDTKLGDTYGLVTEGSP